jgi:tetratricopeptide (TPR) repeat protein
MTPDMTTPDMTTADTGPGPLLERGFAAWHGKELARAHAIFKQACTRHPSHPDAWRGLGSVEWSLKRFDRSLAAFRKGLELDPYNPMHWSTVGVALRDLKRYHEALNVFTVALRLDPEHHEAWNESANVLLDMGRFSAALPRYDRAIELCQRMAVYHHNRGECYFRMGNADLARRNFKAAVAIDPKYRYSIARLRELEARGV